MRRSHLTTLVVAFVLWLAMAQLTADVNGHQFAAQVRPPAEPFVIEKDVSVTVNADGSRTFAVQLELVRTVTIVADAVTGAPTLSVTGDINGTMPLVKCTPLRSKDTLVLMFFSSRYSYWSSEPASAPGSREG